MKGQWCCREGVHFVAVRVLGTGCAANGTPALVTSLGPLCGLETLAGGDIPIAGDPVSKPRRIRYGAGPGTVSVEDEAELPK